MNRPDFSGKDVVNALTSFNFKKDRQKGSHVILKYTHPKSGEVRTVTVPMHDSLKTGTLKSIAEQAGAHDFQKFCDWINRNR
jgi:predicted RNA binding protein YcfA (HicA-like mRNA interferase family)